MKLKYDLFELEAVATMVFQMNSGMCRLHNYLTVEDVKDAIRDDMVGWSKDIVARDHEFGITSTGGYQVTTIVNKEKGIVGATISVDACIMSDTIHTHGQAEIEI